MRQIKRILYVALLFVVFSIPVNAQVKPSVYTGLGTFVNLGSAIGVGVEFKYESISLSIAGGPSHISSDDMGMDVGLKVYSKIGIFGGVNYGVVGYPGNLVWDRLEKTVASCFCREKTGVRLSFLL